MITLTDESDADGTGPSISHSTTPPALNSNIAVLHTTPKYCEIDAAKMAYLSSFAPSATPTHRPKSEPIFPGRTLQHKRENNELGTHYLLVPSCVGFIPPKLEISRKKNTFEDYTWIHPLIVSNPRFR